MTTEARARDGRLVKAADGTDSDVQLTHGVTISYAAASDLVSVIDRLAVMSSPQVLSRRIVVLRNALIRCCTYASANADVRTEMVAGEDLLSFDPDTAIDSTNAANQLGITGAGVRDLCRRERLVAKFINGRWWIDRESLDLYVEQRSH